MKKTVILYKDIPEDLLVKLKNEFNVIFFDGLTPDNRQAFAEAVKTADGMIGSTYPISNDLLENATNIKAIATISVGYDSFDVSYLTSRGIRLMNTPDALTDTTADTLFALVIATARRVAELDTLIRKGQWTHSIGPEHYGIDVHHKTIGIIGMGRIGSALAKRAHAGFDMKVLYNARTQHSDVEENYQATRCELNELLQQSDFVCLTVPLTKETEHLIAKEQFKLMKPTAILINGARGKVVNEHDMIEALKTGVIRAAGLDVFTAEPLPGSSPLISLPNTVLLPHIGSATTETRYKMVECAIDNLIAALKAEKPTENWVNPQAG
ncbi:NAD(P)-dependent oxidoreductase [Zophobihabitans entericus]|uniref:Glyoxylate/hydroxypyruvate reductase B n=1 Tax=Zophobihabitans entericus TaxID=1635327 RepID=A0A6G9IBA9_9GAMM|nr:NAD(P)-dependent oxidoreductase [Zophobihabitans entericus]QIQ20994.1 NAD(P)-binding domain-containing protein [Zophobihabitans entericus]